MPQYFAEPPRHGKILYIIEDRCASLHVFPDPSSITITVSVRAVPERCGLELGDKQQLVKNKLR